MLKISIEYSSYFFAVLFYSIRDRNHVEAGKTVDERMTLCVCIRCRYIHELTRFGSDVLESPSIHSFPLN